MAGGAKARWILNGRGFGSGALDPAAVPPDINPFPAGRARIAARDQARRLPDARPSRRRADPPHLAARARLGRSSQPVNALAVRSCIIDSELIVCDANGLADFQLLRRRKRDDPAVLCVFDLIEI